MHESSRLCHVIASPIHTTALGRLHRKAELRAELDKGDHVPWSNEFEEWFNDESFKLVLPEICDGVTEFVLQNFNSCLHPQKRLSSILKTKWNKLRLRYTVTRRKVTRSGQRDSEVFADCTDGDRSFCCMHCVFHNFPALEYVIQTLSVKALVEERIADIDARSLAEPTRERKRKRPTAESVVGGFDTLVKSIASPMKIEGSSTAQISWVNRSKLQ